MLNDRINAIQKWAEKAADLDSSANTAIALGIALAHIAELVDSVNTANAENVRLHVVIDAEKAKNLTASPYKPFTPFQPGSTNPFDGMVYCGGTPYNFTYTVNTSAGSIEDTESKIEDAIKENKDRYFDSVEDTKQAIDEPTQLEKDLGAAFDKAYEDLKAPTEINSETHDSSTSSITVKNLLDKHFLEDVPTKEIMMYQINPDIHNKIVEELVKQDAVKATKETVEAFENKYGGEIAVIEEPFEGLAVLAPGMDEKGHITETNQNYHYQKELEAKIKDKTVNDFLNETANTIKRKFSNI